MREDLPLPATSFLARRPGLDGSTPSENRYNKYTSQQGQRSPLVPVHALFCLQCFLPQPAGPRGERWCRLASQG